MKFVKVGALRVRQCDVKRVTELPLQELAADIGRMYSRGLTVGFLDLSEFAHLGLKGLFYPRRRGGTPSPQCSAGDEWRASRDAAIVLGCYLRDDLAETWAHELAHALDPAYLTRPREHVEDYADGLGPMLLRVAPTSVLHARSLWASAEQTDRRTEAPDNGVPSAVRKRVFRDGTNRVIDAPLPRAWLPARLRPHHQVRGVPGQEVKRRQAHPLRASSGISENGWSPSRRR